jgi:hypothetical protein
MRQATHGYVTDAGSSNRDTQLGWGGLAGEAPDPAYCNRDLAPTPPSERTWGLRDVAALWVALAVGARGSHTDWARRRLL